MHPGQSRDFWRAKQGRKRRHAGQRSAQRLGRAAGAASCSCNGGGSSLNDCCNGGQRPPHGQQQGIQSGGGGEERRRPEQPLGELPPRRRNHERVEGQDQHGGCIKHERRR